MLAIILILLAILVVSTFVYHAVRSGNLGSRIPEWIVDIIGPTQQPTGPVVAMQQDINRAIERGRIVTLAKVQVAPQGVVVYAHPDDAARARAVLDQMKREAVATARGRGLVIGETFELRVYDDPTRAPRRPKTDTWIAGQQPPGPPAVTETFTDVRSVLPGAVPTPQAETAGTARPAPSSSTGSVPVRTGTDLPTQPAVGNDLPTHHRPVGNDLPTEHRPVEGMLQLTDRDTGRALPLKSGVQRQLLGRSQEADVVLHDPSISREHAWLVCRDGEYTIEATATSKNGVWVNSRSALAGNPTVLKEGDLVALSRDVVLTATYASAA